MLQPNNGCLRYTNTNTILHQGFDLLCTPDMLYEKDWTELDCHFWKSAANILILSSASQIIEYSAIFHRADRRLINRFWFCLQIMKNLYCWKVLCTLWSIMLALKKSASDQKNHIQVSFAIQFPLNIALVKQVFALPDFWSVNCLWGL